MKTAHSCGKRLYIGGKSYVTSNTDLDEHVSFNGMAISGNGHVVIGKYFHSGPGCQIITSFHNVRVIKYLMIVSILTKMSILETVFGWETM